VGLQLRRLDPLAAVLAAPAGLSGEAPVLYGARALRPRRLFGGARAGTALVPLHFPERGHWALLEVDFAARAVSCWDSRLADAGAGGGPAAAAGPGASGGLCAQGPPGCGAAERFRARALGLWQAHAMRWVEGVWETHGRRAFAGPFRASAWRRIVRHDAPQQRAGDAAESGLFVLEAARHIVRSRVGRRRRGPDLPPPLTPGMPVRAPPEFRAARAQWRSELAAQRANRAAGEDGVAAHRASCAAEEGGVGVRALAKAEAVHAAV
jgi:hypothetical protein